MHPMSILVVYVVIWWLVFFMALPIGIHASTPADGTMAGAPENPRIKAKIIGTTLVTALLTAAYVWLSAHGYFAFLELGYGKGLQ